MTSPLRLLALAAPALLAACDTGGIASGDGRIYAGGTYFGKYLALDGDAALASAYGSDEAFVLRHSADGWEREAQLTPPRQLPEDALFGWSVALDADIAVIGAPVFGTASETVPGRAYIYEKRGTTWERTAELVPPQPAAGARLGYFGLPVAVSEGRVAVTSNASTASPSDEVVGPAAVLIYERTATGWMETARVEETELSPNGRTEGFGYGMALDGDRLAVGSPGQDVGGVQGAGVIRVYERAGTAWPLAATLTVPRPQERDVVGESVALDGPLLAAASTSHEVEGELGSGAVFVFRQTSGTWAYDGMLRPPDLGFLDSYGYALDADAGPGGERVAVSAAGREGTRGSVFVWVRQPSGAWELEAELWPEGRGRGTGFGEGVAIEGDRLLAGAIGVGGEEGAVYEFRRGPSGWEQVTF